MPALCSVVRLNISPASPSGSTEGLTSPRRVGRPSSRAASPRARPVANPARRDGPATGAHTLTRSQVCRGAARRPRAHRAGTARGPLGTHALVAPRNHRALAIAVQIRSARRGQRRTRTAEYDGFSVADDSARSGAELRVDRRSPLSCSKNFETRWPLIAPCPRPRSARRYRSPTVRVRCAAHAGLAVDRDRGPADLDREVRDLDRLTLRRRRSRARPPVDTSPEVAPEGGRRRRARDVDAEAQAGLSGDADDADQGHEEGPVLPRDPAALPQAIAAKFVT